MSSELSKSDEDYKVLLARNNDLARENQYLKLMLSRKEEEKLDYIKEVGELRLKLSRLLNGGAKLEQKLDVALQSTSEEALSYIVQASTALTKSIEIVKTYLKDRQDLEKLLPRWSNINGTPSDKVLKVPPMMMGGQFIQPVVTLNRHVNNTRSPRRPNVTQREVALPIHMLQDVYIPLTRIDMEIPNASMENSEVNGSMANSDEGGLDNDLEGSIEESQNEDEFEASNRLEVVQEDPETEQNEALRVPRTTSDNPLEGPSWLLDGASPMTVRRMARVTLEADSTTQLDDSLGSRPKNSLAPDGRGSQAVMGGSVFSPTRRRKRPVSPPSPPSPSSPLSYRSPLSVPSSSPMVTHSPLLQMHDPHAARKIGRILKVLVPKMVMGESTPCRAEPSSMEPRFDAPSPNGATMPCVVLSETIQNTPEIESVNTRQLQPPTQRRESHDADVSRPKRRNRSTSLSDFRPSPVEIRPSPGEVGPSPALVRPSPSTSRANGDQRKSRHITDPQRKKIDAAHKKKNKNIRKLNIVKNNGEPDRGESRSPDSDEGEIASNTLGSGDTQSTRVGESISRASVSDSGSGDDSGGTSRSRRTRKPVTYKEKPLNRKMRR